MQQINLHEMKPDFRKLLLVGPEGCGKTRFIGTMPRPICVCSFDKGISTLAGEEGITAYIFMDDDRRSPKAWSEFRSFYSDLKAGKVKYKRPDGTEEPYKTFAVDSITALSKFILDHANYVNNTIDSKGENYNAYKQTKSFLEDVVVTGILASEYFVGTAIIEPDKDNLTGTINYLPSTEGKFRTEAGQWFDVVGFMSIDVNPSTKQLRAPAPYSTSYPSRLASAGRNRSATWSATCWAATFCLKQLGCMHTSGRAPGYRSGFVPVRSGQAWHAPRPGTRSRARRSNGAPFSSTM